MAAVTKVMPPRRKMLPGWAGMGIVIRSYDWAILRQSGPALWSIRPNCPARPRQIRIIDPKMMLYRHFPGNDGFIIHCFKLSRLMRRYPVS